jgi:hypothetical protein
LSRVDATFGVFGSCKACGGMLCGVDAQHPMSKETTTSLQLS